MNTFQIELSMTNDCNLKCPYCYVKQNHKSLTLETFKKALPKIHHYMKLANCSNYDIAFFGGEPLLKFDLIKKIIPILRQDKYFNHCTVVSNLALLTPQMRDYFKENKISVSWSFDGITSNVSRATKNGKNVIEIYESKKDLILSLVNGCHSIVYPENCLDMLRNAEYMHNFGLKRIDFAVVRDNVWKPRDIENFKSVLPKLHQFLSDNNIYGGFFELMRCDIRDSEEYGKRDFGCFAGVNGCSVSTDGEIFACERFETNGKFNYEKMDNPFKFKSTYNPKNYEKCKKCELYNFCNCGCLYSQLQNGNQPLDCVCELFKAIYEIVKDDTSPIRF